MAFPALPYLTLPGLMPGGGGTCDYPSEDDVREGINYDFGAQTGNLVLPDEDDVLFGVGYGSNGTEFIGTFGVGPITPPIAGTSPFAAIAKMIVARLIASTGLPSALVLPVANDKYKITVTDSFFLYVRFFKMTQPRDQGLDYENSGGGRRVRPVARRVRIYIYTRQGTDPYGSDPVALFGEDPTDVATDPPTTPGHFLAEEIVQNALDDWLVVNNDGTPLTLGPLHTLDSSEEPERPAEEDKGLVRSCLDYEAVYNLAIDPTDPAS